MKPLVIIWYKRKVQEKSNVNSVLMMMVVTQYLAIGYLDKFVDIELFFLEHIGINSVASVNYIL